MFIKYLTFFPQSSYMYSSQLQVKIEVNENKGTYKNYEYFYLPVLWSLPEAGFL